MTAFESEPDSARIPLPGVSEGGSPGPSRSWLAIGFQLSLGALLAYLLVHAVESIVSIVMLTLLALVIAISAEPFVQALLRRGLPRSWAVTIVLVGLALFLGALSLLFVTPITNEVNALARNVPIWLQQLQNHHSELGRLEDKYHLVEKAKQAMGSGGANSVASGLLGAGQLVVTTVSGLSLVVTLTIYFLSGLPTLKEFCLRFVAGSRREHAAEITDEILSRTGRYMLANVATSVIAGVATYVWLQIFGVPYPAALGVFVAVMDLVPLVGSTIGGIVVSLVALVVSWPVAIATAVFYIFFRVAEDYLITPKAMKYAVEVHPLVTVLGVVIGGDLLGLIGALLAIPIAVAIGLLLEDAVFPRIAAS
ncbi:AI-2E family transporter [Streptomyces sp. NPDC054770]